MKIYLGTSSFVKRYSAEDGSDTVNFIFESSCEIVTLHWTIAEAIAAIDKKLREGKSQKKKETLQFPSSYQMRLIEILHSSSSQTSFSP